MSKREREAAMDGAAKFPGPAEELNRIAEWSGYRKRHIIVY